MTISPVINLAGVIIILFAGVLELILIKFILHRQKIDIELIVVLEHFVQWALVYFVIYQTITQKFKEDVIEELQIQHIFDTTYLNIAILPSLIVTWIAIFSYRMKQY
ncbi:TPA: SA1002 family membrane protein [Staphylococcus pseudintermedius]